jgi:hypothetical protein
VYVLRDIQDGVGRISASEAKARLERVRGAVGDAAPERTTPPETLSDGTYPDSRLPWSPST